MTIRITLASFLLAGACTGDTSPLGGPDDGRAPELGNDPKIVRTSKISMADAVAQAGAQGAVIEAKFELDDSGALSLSTYPIGASVDLDAERSVFQELSGDPVASAWAPSLEVFHDFEHLTRSSRDLTLVQLSKLTVADAVDAASDLGFVYWTIPTIHGARAGYGVFALDSDGDSHYRFVDGGGDETRPVFDLGTGPGVGATDARVPELGADVTIVHQSKIKMSDAIAQMESAHGEIIEAKFELDDSGALSLSLYPASDVTAAAEKNTFIELSGDPTAAAWAPDSETFMVPDEEHLTRAARDLTLVQTAALPLREAVAQAEAKFPGGFVYWAIPTRRGTTSGYGIYVLDAQGATHYLFVS